MKLIHIIILLLSISIPIHAAPDRTNLTQSKVTQKSHLQTIKEHPLKFTLGYTGYFTANLSPLILLGPVNIWGAIGSSVLLAPITGPIGASIGVHLAGVMQGKESTFHKSTIQSLKGGVLGLWTYLLPVPILNPIIPTVHAIHSFHSNERFIKPRKETQAMSIHPIKVTQLLLKATHLNNKSHSPIQAEYERIFSTRTSFYLNGSYQNHSITKEYEDDTLFTVTQAHASKTWQAQYYEASIGFKHYRSQNFTGLYMGSGLSLFYASFLEKGYDVFDQSHFNNIQTWDSWTKETGSGYFIKPFIEVGYKLFLSQRFFIKTQIRTGPIQALNTGTLKSTRFNFPPYLIKDKESMHTQLSIQTGWSW